MHVVIFEGSRWPTFAPLSLSRPVFTLASGMGTLLDKQLRYLRPTRLTLWVRAGLAEYCRKHVLAKLDIPSDVNTPLDDEPALLVSGRTLHREPFEYPTDPTACTDGQGITWALTRSPGLSPQDAMRRTDEWMALFDLPRTGGSVRMASYVWDLLGWNEESLIDDAAAWREGREPHAPGPYHMVNDEDVCLAADVKLAPGVVLDATKGPVAIGRGASIGANSVLFGPCYVGPQTQISPLTQIRGGTTIGPVCKVGGEVGNSIVMGYTNKAHDGYLGDSYVGEWVNFGAGTTTSNLKNTYGSVTMRIGGTEIQTGRRLLGSVVGDHSKTAIGTRLMTGSYLGYCSMIALSKLPPRFVPSFTFLTDKAAERYKPEKATEVMRAVFGRRGRQWTPDDAALLAYAAETAGMVEAQ